MNQNLPQEIVEHVVTETKIFERSELWNRPWWMDNRFGKFIVKSAWDILRHKQLKDECLSKIWMQG